MHYLGIIILYNKIMYLIVFPQTMVFINVGDALCTLKYTMVINYCIHSYEFKK